MGKDQTATIRRVHLAAQTATALPTTSPLSRQELTTAFTLASALFLRMLALFMLTPVRALYVDALAGATPLLIGLTIGVYGLPAPHSTTWKPRCRASFRRSRRRPAKARP